MRKFRKYVIGIIVSLITGAVCGLCGVAFSKTLTFVTQFRQNNNWIVWFLAVGGLLSVVLYKFCKINGAGTESIFETARNNAKLPATLPIAVFLGTALSHLFGASAGREGAALQIGGGVADTLGKVFKLDENLRCITVTCGMAALFSAVFGTPFAACAFALEVVFTKLCFSAVIPVLCSSVTAFAVATIFKVSPERFNLGTIPNVSLPFVLKAILITAVSIAVAFVFCKGLHLGKKLFKKIFKNEYLRIAVGGLIITALTLLLGTYDYNGGGVDIIERVFEGSVRYEAFALKLLFTVICVAAGYKGGEIIPTLFIGATLGGTLASILNMPLGTGAAIGMAVLFCAATKAPLATVLLCAEMFGINCVPIVLPVVIVTFAVARYDGLYSNSNDIIKYFINSKKSEVK